MNFTHTYKVINKGPSYTNTEKTMNFYLPHTNFTTIMKGEKTDGMFCSRSTNPTNVQMQDSLESISESENSFSCKSDTCIVFECRVPRNWRKNELKSFSVITQFNTKDAKKMSKVFSIHSIASLKDSTQGLISPSYLDH